MKNFFVTVNKKSLYAILVVFLLPAGMGQAQETATQVEATTQLISERTPTIHVFDDEVGLFVVGEKSVKLKRKSGERVAYFSDEYEEVVFIDATNENDMDRYILGQGRNKDSGNFDYWFIRHAYGGYDRENTEHIQLQGRSDWLAENFVKNRQDLSYPKDVMSLVLHDEICGPSVRAGEINSQCLFKAKNILETSQAKVNFMLQSQSDTAEELIESRATERNNKKLVDSLFKHLESDVAEYCGLGAALVNPASNSIAISYRYSDGVCINELISGITGGVTIFIADVNVEGCKSGYCDYSYQLACAFDGRAFSEACAQHMSDHPRRAGVAKVIDNVAIETQRTR